MKHVWKEEKKNIVISASEIIRVLHPRAKPSEQEMRKARQPDEQDAELAINCLGVLLKDIGWAKG